jgi:uncharacterized protein (DUF488 family)
VSVSVSEAKENTIYTVGHSNQSLESFLGLLSKHAISAIADVRSYPYSMAFPQFDREALSKELKANGISYVFLGKELGARSEDPSCYSNGKVQFEKLAKTELFQDGIGRVFAGMEQYRVAMMCAEKEPLACHRTILVARAMAERGVKVLHILSDGAVEEHEAATERLLALLDMSEPNMFVGKSELVDEAYRIQADRIAYERDDSDVAVG